MRLSRPYPQLWSRTLGRNPRFRRQSQLGPVTEMDLARKALEWSMRQVFACLVNIHPPPFHFCRDPYYFSGVSP